MAGVPEAVWRSALEALRGDHGGWPELVLAGGWALWLRATLGEEQFGADRYRLSLAKRLYYLLKPVLPRALTVRARRRYRTHQEASFPLRWPVDERFPEFMHALLGEVLRRRPDAKPAPLWPDGARSALVLTHDVETGDGLRHVPRIAELEASRGLRSSFNFVPERYVVDAGLIRELRDGGFEVGVHGLKHDGLLYLSHAVFRRRARRINQWVERWQAAGFRSPLTHRNPEWLQEIDAEYDTSFFDTDPYEPMPGGVMTVWPFFLGRLVELPYTLLQDYTLYHVLGERTAALWLDKARRIHEWRGMTLINTHPDYLAAPGLRNVYESFLDEVQRADVWHALPRATASWWRERAVAKSVVPV